MMTDPLTIAVFIPGLNAGGVEKNMIHLTRGFVDQGHDVDLVLARAEGPFLADVDPRVNVVDLGASRVLLALPRLAKYLRRRRPGVLLAGMGHANIVSVVARWFARSSCRVVISDHTVPTVHHEVLVTRMARLVVFLMRFFYPRADAVVAVSNDVAVDVAKLARLPREAVTVIGNPVVTEELRQGFSRRPVHRFFRSGGRPVFLSIGRMDAQKGFDVLLQASRLLQRTVPHNLLILGDGPDRDALEKLAAELDLGDSVDMPGFVPDVPGYIAQSSVFVLASRFEGFGNVLVEALAGGLPVVATRCAGGPVAILEDGRYGPLVPVESPRALAEAMAATLASPVPADALRARAEDFDAGRISGEYLALFRRLGG